MASDDFDDPAVLTCLRRGVAYGPETRKGQTRYNMVHRNLHVRVVVGWSVGLELGALQRLTVITVMRIEE